jgi:tRNA(adenine34) deaminase
MSNKFFQAALKEAEKASRKDEVPIGCVIVKDDKIIARSHNQTEAKKTFTAHAELVALNKASKKLGSKHLVGCEMYITLEPCKMCRAATQLCRIDAVHYLASSEKFGKKGTAYFKTKVSKKKSPLTLHSLQLLREFFSKKR